MEHQNSIGRVSNGIIAIGIASSIMAALLFGVTAIYYNSLSERNRDVLAVNTYGDTQFLANHIYAKMPAGSSIFGQVDATVNLDAVVESGMLSTVRELDVECDLDLYKMTADRHPVVRMVAMWCLYMRNGSSATVTVICSIDDSHQCVRAVALKILYDLYPDSPIREYYQGGTPHVTQFEATELKRSMFQWASGSAVVDWTAQLPQQHGDPIDVSRIYSLSDQ